MPTTRSLVRKHGASAATVQAALRALSAEGSIDTRPGAGSFVAAPRNAPVPDFGWQSTSLGAAPAVPALPGTSLRDAAPGVINMGEGYPDPSLLPLGLVRAALSRAARGEHLSKRPPTAGLAPLRAWFASQVAAATPSQLHAVGPSDVLILPGSQAGLSLVFRAIAGQGGALLIESPSYWGATLAAAQAGVTLVPVASGPDGPDPEDVERAFARSGARAFYAQPTFANPHGASWPAQNREQILAVCARHAAFVIEDDWARDFAIDAAPSPLAASDADGRVIYLRSLTKSTVPSLRVAAVIARGPARERIHAEVRAQAMYVSGVLQAAALDVVTHASWASHLHRLRGSLRARRDLLMVSLADHAPSLGLPPAPAGGLNLWVSLPAGTEEAQVTAAAEAMGLLIPGGRASFPAEAAGAFLRFNFGGAPADDLVRASQVLGRVMSSPLP